MSVNVDELQSIQNIPRKQVQYWIRKGTEDAIKEHHNVLGFHKPKFVYSLRRISYLLKLIFYLHHHVRNIQYFYHYS